MTDPIERLRGATITTRSPDGSVRASFGKAGSQIAIEFKPHSLHSHTEKSLSSQVTAVLNGTLAGYGKAAEMLAEPRSPQPDPIPEPTRAQREVRSAMAAVDFSVSSPNGCVLVHWQGASQVRVDIAAGSIGRFNDAQLAQQVGSTFTEAAQEYGRRVVAIYERAYPAEY